MKKSNTYIFAHLDVGSLNRQHDDVLMCLFVMR
jgi:hypothetical protein